MLYYLTQEQLQRSGVAEGRPSATTWVNEINGQVIEVVESDPEAAVIQVSRDDRRVLATRTALTGWFVVLAMKND